MKIIKLLIFICALYFLSPLMIFAAGLDDFIITVKTDNPGTSSPSAFTIPTSSSNYNVDCNDDGIDEVTGFDGSYTCDYSALGGPGTYTIRIEDNIGDGTGFSSIKFNNTGDKDKILSVDQWGTAIWIRDGLEAGFFGALYLNINASDAPDLSEARSFFRLFRDAESVNFDPSSWDTSNIRNMRETFLSAISFSGDVSSWDTSNVLTMEAMFARALSFNQDLSGFEMGSVVQAQSMLANSGLSTTNYDNTLIGWESQTLQSAVPLGATGLSYCNSVAERNSLQAPPTNWSITGDTLDCSNAAPASPTIAPDLQSTSDTGNSMTDNITMDNTPTFDVACSQSGNVITLYSNIPAANTAIGTLTCTSVGTASITSSTTLTDGTHLISYTDSSASNESGSSPTLSVLIDTTSPSTPSCSTTPNPVIYGTSVTTTCSSVEQGTTLSIPNMSCSPIPTDATEVVSCFGTTGASSPNVFTSDDVVTVTDVAGNSNTSATTGLVIDAMAPVSPTVDAILSGATTITGTGENGTIITLNIGVCTNAPVVVSASVWSCDISVADAPGEGDTITATSTDGLGNFSTGSYTIPNPSSGNSGRRGGSRRIFVCKDTEALNYSRFGTHSQSKCEYANNNVVSSNGTEENPFGGEQCPVNLIITDNMKQGDRNGQYSVYNRGIVTQIDILQGHMNRLLLNEYGNQASGPVDSIFGPLTKRGVERLQNRLNQLLPNMTPLVIDGIVGPFTKAAINMSC